MRLDINPESVQIRCSNSSLAYSPVKFKSYHIEITRISITFSGITGKAIFPSLLSKVSLAQTLRERKSDSKRSSLINLTRLRHSPQ